MRLRVATYNVLADAYVKASYFPHAPAELLRGGARRAGVVARVLGLAGDVICLQEVDRPTYAALRDALAPSHTGAYAAKGRSKPDGCAAFVRRDAARLVSHERIAYADGDDDGPDSGHVALALRVAVGERRLGVATTHLKWDRPSRAPDAHRGVRQARLLRAALAPEVPWIVCGDLNAEPGSAVLDTLQARGWRPAHGAAPPPTCAATGPARAIDHLLHDAALTATPEAPAALDPERPLPHADEPSDHLPLCALFAWA